MRTALVWMSGVFFTICAGMGAAQEQRTGTVTGHVLCNDTQRPARLAQVRLVPFPTAAAKDALGENDLQTGGQITQTTLDGSYTLRNVRPGTYLVAVDKDGYLSPLTDFTGKDLVSTDEAVRVRVARELRVTEVQPDQADVVDVTLERGASVAGTVLYDDGTPAGGLMVKLLERNAQGKLIARQPNGLHWVGSDRTDDQGRYRFSGLPAGDYATEVDLVLTDRSTTHMEMPGRPGVQMAVNFETTRYSLGLFSGDKLRRTQADTYSLGPGQDHTGADLTFPLSKLHRVTGQIVAKGGHAINGGHVSLAYADDQSPLTETDVDLDEAQFRMDFVPEGDYTVKVAKAEDLARYQVENPKGVTPRLREETRSVHAYGDGEAALKVTGDVQDVVVTVPEAKAKPAAAKEKPAP